MGGVFSSDSEDDRTPDDGDRDYQDRSSHNLQAEEHKEPIKHDTEPHGIVQDESIVEEFDHLTLDLRIEEPVNQEAAVSTLRYFNSALTIAIQEPLSQLATPLYSKGLLSSQDLERAQLSSVIRSEKNAQLLNVIERQVMANPQHFVTFFSTITKERVLNSLAVELKETYDKFCDDPKSLTIPCSPDVHSYAQYLKKYYSSSSIKPEFKWRPPLSLEEYVNLALIKKESINQNNADEYTLSTLHGNVDQILSKKEPIAMEEVLDPPEGQQSVKCVLLDGAPGVGKSTFAWELCRKWDDIRALKKYSLVLLLRFREKCVQNATKIKHLFYHDDSELQKAVAKEVVRLEGHGLLLILDGYDELPVSLRSDSLLARIMRGESLPKCTLLITSRPSAMQHLQTALKRKITKHVEVLGFTQKNVEEYAIKVFQSTPNQLEDFLAYISMSQNPAIRSLMYIPLNCAIVTNLYKVNKMSGKPIPHTMTQLYTECCLVLLRRYLASKGDPMFDCISHRLKDLPQYLYELVLNLAQVAFNGILDQVVVFEKLPESCSALGFTAAVPELYLGSRGVKSYSFLHLTLQEFLAAFYLSQLSAESEDCQKFLLKWNQKYLDVVLMFFSGLTGENPAHFCWKIIKAKGKRVIDPTCSMSTVSSSQVNAMQDVIEPSGRTFLSNVPSHQGIRIEWNFRPDVAKQPKKCSVMPLLFLCAFESQEKQIFESLLSDEKKLEFYASPLSGPFDYYALGHSIATHDGAWSLSFADVGLSGDVLQMLASGLNSAATIQGKIETFNLSGVPLGENGLRDFDNFPQIILRKLKILDVSCCHERPYTPLSIEHFAVTNVRLMTTLQTLNISFNPLKESGVAPLLKALRDHPSLRTLIMVDNGIGLADLCELSSMLETTHLTELRIGGSKFEPMKPETTDALMKVILQPSTLQTINVLFVHFGSTKTCIDLQRNETITTLALTSCVNINSAVVQLSSALKRNKTLKTVKILQVSPAQMYVKNCDKVLDPLSEAALAEMITVNETLENLDLHDIFCSFDGSINLYFSLDKNHSLKHLKLLVVNGKYPKGHFGAILLKSIPHRLSVDVQHFPKHC